MYYLEKSVKEIYSKQVNDQGLISSVNSAKSLMDFVDREPTVLYEINRDIISRMNDSWSHLSVWARSHTWALMCRRRNIIKTCMEYIL